MGDPNEVMDIPDRNEYGCSVFDPLIDEDSGFCFLCNFDTSDPSDKEFAAFNLYVASLNRKFSTNKTVNLFYEYYNRHIREHIEIVVPATDTSPATTIHAPEWTKEAIFRHFKNHSTEYFDFQFAYQIETALKIMDVLQQNMLDSTGTKIDLNQMNAYSRMFITTLQAWEKYNRKR